MSIIIETTLQETIGQITGLSGGNTPLGGRKVEFGANDIQNIIADFFKTILSEKHILSDNPLIPLFNELKEAFSRAHSDENETFLENRLSILRSEKDPNIRAKATAEI